MEFWAAEVKPGEELEVDVGEGGCMHLTRACIGEIEEESVTVRINAGVMEVVLAHLHPKLLPSQLCDLEFVENFKIRHNMQSASVYLFGVKRKHPKHGYPSLKVEKKHVGYAVKPGRRGYGVQVKAGRLDNLLSASLGNDVEVKDQTVLVYITVDGKQYVFANLNPLTRDTEYLMAFLDRDFKLSHNLKKGKVDIVAFKVKQRNLIHKSDTESDEEKQETTTSTCASRPTIEESAMEDLNLERI